MGGRRARLSTIVIEVTAFYIQLWNMDAELVITGKTLDVQQESFQLISLRENIGQQL